MKNHNEFWSRSVPEVYMIVSSLSLPLKGQTHRNPLKFSESRTSLKMRKGDSLSGEVQIGSQCRLAKPLLESTDYINTFVA